MKLRNSTLLILILLALAGSTGGAWFFSTWSGLPRSLQDVMSMAVLFAGLLMAGGLILNLLIRAGARKPSS